MYVCMYDAEDVLCLVNYHNQDVTCFSLKAQHPEEAEVVTEPEPDHKERSMMDLKLTEGLGLIEDGIKVFEDIALNKWRVATTRQGIMRLLACCEEILKEKKKKKSLSLQSLLFDSFKSSSETCSLPLVLLDIGDGDPDNHPLHFKIVLVGKSGA